MKYVIVLGLFTFLNGNILGQGITIKQAISDIPGICNQVSFLVTVRNDDNQNWNENKLSVQLPCGFDYDPGSIMGASEFNIDNLSSPIFDMATIPQKTEKVLSFRAVLSCKTLECLNNGSLFRNEYTLNSPQGQKKVDSEFYNVETPNIVVTQIQDPFQEVFFGNSITRKLTIKNTRLGKINSFRIEDLYDPLLIISMDKGKVIVDQSNKLIMEIGSTEFEKIGNHDGFFDFGEELVITETIFANGCVLTPKFVQSEISVSWGCFNETCKSNLVLATCKILPRDDPGDKFSVTTQAFEPQCFYNSNKTQKLSIVVRPTASALNNIEILVESNYEKRGFIKESVVLPAGFEVNFIDEKLSKCNQLIAQKLIITSAGIPASQVGRLLEFYFDMAFCEISACDKDQVNWKVKYEYKKSCTKLDDVFHEGQVTAKVSNTTTQQLDFLIEGSADDGKSGVIKYTYQNANLTTTQGILKVRLVFPLFLTLINSNYAIGNIVPTFEHSISGENRIIELSYPLPLNVSSFTIFVPVLVNCSEFTTVLNCVDYISNCNVYCEPDRAYNIQSSATLISDLSCPNGANPEHCALIDFYSNCQPECSLSENVGGFVNYNFDVKRINIGLPDKNNDNFPDPDGIYDESLIRHDQIFYGDTFDLLINGGVYTEHLDSTYKNAFAKLSFLLVPGTDYFFFETATEITSASFILWDKSSNQKIHFDNIPYTFNALTFSFDLSFDTLKSRHPQLPDDFVFENGDSLFLQIRKIFKKNFSTPVNGWSRHTQSFQYLVSMGITNRQLEYQQNAFVCGCPTKDVTFVGFNYWSQWALPGVAQCPGETNTQGVVFNYGFPVSSPGEVKYFIRPVAIKVGKTKNIGLDSVAVSYGLQPQKTYYQFIEDDEFYYVDVSDFTTYQNFRAGLRFWLYRSAEICLSETVSATSAEIIYERSDAAMNLFDEEIKYVVQNFLSVPKILLEVQQKEYTALISGIQIPMKMMNETNNQVQNIFIRPIYDTQSFSDVKIELNGLPLIYPENNGYFDLGNMFQKEIRDIFFTAKSLNCGRQKVVFEYGYNCDVYSNPAESPCFLKRDSVYIDFQDGELEVNISQDDKIIALCDTIQESKFKVFNSGLGHVFNMKPIITLPRGVEIIEGSCRIEYPSGSGQFFNIPQPKYISGRDYQWNLNEVWELHKAEGLYSISNAPQNAFDIYYTLFTNCDFISGTYEKLTVVGEQACGKKSNQLIKSGPELIIPGAQNPAQIDIRVDAVDNLLCQTSFPVSIQYQNLHTENSYMYLELPDGLELVQGSFTGNLPEVEPLVNQNILQWSVPPGISTVHLECVLRAKTDIGCGEVLLEITTTGSREALCEESQMLCEIEEITGRNVHPVFIEKPEIDILNFEMVNHPDSSFLTLKSEVYIQNAAQKIFGKVIYDANNNNKIDVGEPVITDIEFDPGNAQQNIIKSSAKIGIIDSLNNCRLWLILDVNENCICSPDTIQLRNKIVFITDTIPVCWNESITLGPVGNSEKSYQWNVGTGLSCTQCPNPAFGIPNEEDFRIMSYFRHLTEKDSLSGCIQEYSYLVQVYPKPGILNIPDTVCAGETVKIFTTNFSDTYEWSGALIIENLNTFVKVVTDTSTWVYVSMADSIGCVVKDSVFVPIHEIPVTIFSNDGQFCYGQEAIIGYEPEQSIVYHWVDPQMILSDPQSNVSAILGIEGGKVYVKAEKGYCSALDSIEVKFYKSVELSAQQDTFTVCQGDSLTIELSGANQYEWSDPAIGSCLNDSCSMFLVIPETVGIFMTSVIGTNFEGCKDTIQIRILSISSSTTSFSQTEICPGDTITFFNHIINEQGLYCDTVSFGACHYIQCLEVHIKPPLIREVNENICQGDTLFYNGMMFSEAGSHEWTFQGADGCDSLVTLNIGLLPGPEINVPPNIEINIGGTTSINLPNQYIYQWSPSTGLDCNTCSKVTITGNEDILYQVTVTDPSGCTTIYSLQVNVNNICNIEILEIPNAFSPNGDLINDLFTIPDLQVCEISIIVFNRWGNIVYEQKPFDNQWDGKSLNETDLPSGTYYYIIETYDKSVKKTGMIDLRRE